MVILFSGVLHNNIITVVYQQSREQKREGANSPRSPLYGSKAQNRSDLVENGVKIFVSEYTTKIEYL